MAALSLNRAIFLRRVRAVLANYNPFQIIEILDTVRRFDAMSKGNGSRQPATALFRDMLYHIFTAPGKLPV